MPYCDNCETLIPTVEVIELNDWAGVPDGCPVCEQPFRDPMTQREKEMWGVR